MYQAFDQKLPKVDSLELLKFRPAKNGIPVLRGLSITIQGSRQGEENKRRLFSPIRRLLRPRVVNQADLPKTTSTRVCMLPRERHSTDTTHQPIACISLTTLKQLIDEQRVQSIEWYQQFACNSTVSSSTTSTTEETVIVSPSIWINGQQVMLKPEDASKICALLTDTSTMPHTKRPRSAQASLTTQGIVRLRFSGSSSRPLEPPRPQIHSLVQLHLATLCDLHIRRVDITDDEFAALMLELRNCSQLQSLDLSGTLCFVEIKNESRLHRAKLLAEFLCATTSCEQLNLGENRLSKELLTDLFEALGQNTSIVHLNLWGNDLSDTRAVRQLNAALMKRSTRLRVLNLHMTGLKDIGLERLAWLRSSLCSLHTLALSSNHLTHHSRDALIRTVANNTRLTKLLLSGNHLSDDCLTALAPYLRAAPRLCRVALFSNHLQNRALLDELDQVLEAKVARLSCYTTLFSHCWRIVVPSLAPEDVEALRWHFDVTFDRYCSSHECRWPLSKHDKVEWTCNGPLCIYCAHSNSTPLEDTGSISSSGRKQRRTRAKQADNSQESVVVIIDDEDDQKPEVTPEPEPKPRVIRRSAATKRRAPPPPAANTPSFNSNICPTKGCTLVFDTAERRDRHVLESHPHLWQGWSESGLSTRH